jgi:hypothetical protein
MSIILRVDGLLGNLAGTVYGGQVMDTETKKHPQFKRQIQWPHESGFRYMLHYPSDPNREVMVTVLVFDVPSAN